MMYVPIKKLLTQLIYCYFYKCSSQNIESKLLISSIFKISNLIATEILHCEDVVTRVAVIEKWMAVADICRCLHNYNAVLEITSSLNRSSVFRLKKTWLKISKQVCISKCIFFLMCLVPSINVFLTKIFL